MLLGEELENLWNYLFPSCPFADRDNSPFIFSPPHTIPLPSFCHRTIALLSFFHPGQFHVQCEIMNIPVSGEWCRTCHRCQSPGSSSGCCGATPSWSLGGRGWAWLSSGPAGGAEQGHEHDRQVRGNMHGWTRCPVMDRTAILNTIFMRIINSLTHNLKLIR